MRTRGCLMGPMFLRGGLKVETVRGNHGDEPAGVDTIIHQGRERGPGRLEWACQFVIRMPFASHPLPNVSGILAEKTCVPGKVQSLSGYYLYMACSWSEK